MARLFRWFARRRFETEMAEEMRLHLELQAERHRAAGMSDAEAVYAARREFGGVEQIKERCREQRGWSWWDDAIRDLRGAVRLLRRQPGFALLCIAVAAVGIGANTAVFSVLDAMVLRPPDVPDAAEVFRLQETNPPRGVTSFSVSYPNFTDWQARSRSWRLLAAAEERGVNVLLAGRAERGWAQLVTPEFFPLFGWRVQLGRGFTLDDEHLQHGRVVVISDGFWRSRLHADPAVIGGGLTIDGAAWTVIGVLAPGPGFLRESELFLPLRPLVSQDRTDHELDVYGRLRAGVSPEQAAAELETVAAQIEQDQPAANAGWRVRLEPLAEFLVGRTARRSVVLVFAVTGLLLLIACANLAGLLLVRATSRSRELAIRAALGGGRSRLVRQLLMESLLPVAIGGGLGLLLAMWGIDALRAATSGELARSHAIAMDSRVLWFSAAATLATGLLAGGLPARTASRVDLVESLKNGALATKRQPSRLKNGLVVGQLALSIVLLAGALLLLRTLVALQTVDLGYRPESMITARIAPDGDGRERLQRLLDRVRALPGVRAVGAISVPPMMNFNTSLNVFPVGAAALPENESVQAQWRIATGDYFRAMGIPLRAGRTFTRADDESRRPVVVVNESLARRLWGEANPIGREINPGGGTTYSTVVGVVGDVRSLDPAEPPEPGYYMSAHRGLWGPMSLVVRTEGPGETLVPLLRAEWRALDPTTPLFRVERLSDLVDLRLAPRRQATWLLALFAGVALLLAAAGLYGIVAHTTGQRTREIGIRVALGAGRSDVLRSLMRDGFRLIGLGAGIGLGLALGAAQLLRGLLAGASPIDPFALVGAVALLALVALLAAWLPARRAAKVDPILALRCE